MAESPATIGIEKAARGLLSDTEREDWLGGLLGARVRIGCSAHWNTLTGIRIVRIALGSDRRQETCETCDLQAVQKFAASRATTLAMAVSA